MAVITTYVCDVSGKQGNKEDFVDVQIKAFPSTGYNSYNCVIINKLIHKDVAYKLGMVKGPSEVQQPEPTLESKLMILLKDYITELAYEAGGEAGSEAASNYNR